MKARVLFHTLAALILVALLIGLPGSAEAKTDGPCGPNVVQKGKVFLVRPNGVDDTAAIQCALDQATAYGPGAVVQLAEGTFYTGFVTAYGFNGIFRGMGLHKTFIEALPDLRCDLKYSQNLYPTLFEFRTAKTRFSDLTLRFLDETPCVLPEEGNPFYQGNSLGIAVGFSANFIDSCDLEENSRADVQVDSIAILAVPGEFPDPSYYGTNLVHGVVYGSSFNKGIPGCPEVGARTTGNFTLTRSRFDAIALPVFVLDLQDAKFVIGGSAAMANTFQNLGHVYIRSNFNTLGVISYNHFDNVFWQSVTLLVDAPSDWFVEPVDQPSTYLVEHNTLNLAAGSTGFWIEDGNIAVGLPAGMRAGIKNNRVNFNGFYHWGLFAPYAENFTLAKNIFVGTAELVAWIGKYPAEGEPLITAQNWLVKDNNVDQAQFTWAHYILRPTSANNVVIGTGQEIVIDEGTDNILRNVILQAAQVESRMAIQGAESQAPASPKTLIDTRWH